ncbi:sigma factor-like helix-turn-helix DNA-binding protein [Paenibacillus ferrarius]|uniref:sigma factor-like helix-turn-helix DNA-binding protein n=1 Tax=Paenibacillus ferrarius TaxID=1469647 RepID=UPI003D29B56A
MSLHDLLLQYMKTVQDLRALKDQAERQEDQKLLAEMISDCEYVVHWLRTGRAPGNRRGVERRSVYELTKVWDPSWFESFTGVPIASAERELTAQEEFGLHDAMAALSERERQCYILHIGFEFSWEQVARELNITIRTVRTHYQRAEQKIEHVRKNLLTKS